MKTLRLYFSLFLLIFVLPIASASAALTIDITTNPSVQEIGPDASFVNTTFTVKDEQGQVVPGAYVKIHVHSPKRNPIISTDFPWVEYTHLIEYAGYLPAGIWSFDYIYPIRGSYRIDVQAGLNPESLSEKKSLALSISENRVELRNIIILLCLLAGFGFIAGTIIGRGARSKMAMASLTLISLGLAVSNVYAEDHAHHGSNSTLPAFTETAAGSNMTVDFTMNPGGGKVGMLNEVTLTAKDAQGALIPETIFDVKLWHIEDDKPVFSTKLLGKDGRAKINFQFFDGAEHEVRVVAKNGLGEMTLTRVVDVEAIHPPMSAKVKTDIYFVLITFLGILLGLRLQNTPKLRPA